MLVKSIKISGLRCNNINCNYEINDIDMDNFEDYLESSCPICGDSLINNEDVRIHNKILSLNRAVNDSVLDRILKDSLDEDIDFKVSFDSDNNIIILKKEKR